MPSFTITLTQKTVDKLQQQVQRTNENTGTTLTLTQWIKLNQEERAIADDLTAAITAIQQQQQADAQTAFNDAVTAARDELLAEL